MSHTLTSGDFFYKEQALAAGFVEYPFGLSATKFKVKAIAAAVEFSWDGISSHGKIETTDGIVEFAGLKKGKVWLKGTGATARVWAWE